MARRGPRTGPVPRRGREISRDYGVVRSCAGKRVRRTVGTARPLSALAYLSNADLRSRVAGLATVDTVAEPGLQVAGLMISRDHRPRITQHEPLWCRTPIQFVGSIFGGLRGLLKGDVAFHAGMASAFATRRPMIIPNRASVCGPVQFQSGFTVSLGEW